MKNNLDRLLGYLLEVETAKKGDLFENGVGGDFPEDKISGGDVSNGKKLLLLVHPDIVFEPGNIDFIEEYIDRLRDEMPKFDYVITHKFFSDAAPELIDNIGKNLDLWNELMDVLEAESDWIKRDYKFSASFSDALPDYLIDNEGTQIWLGGGYEKLCVADTQKALMKKLGDVIGETGASIAGCYGTLIITQRHNPSFGDQPVKEHYSSLRECIKMITENVNEAMETEPPEGYYVDISGNERVIRIRIKSKAGGRPKLAGMMNVGRGITVPAAGAHDGGLVWEVANVEAEPGYGPMLYDLAMEMVLLVGGVGLMPDRTYVSPSARGVWEKYYSRGDIDKEPLPEDIFDFSDMRNRPDYMRYYYSKSGTPLMNSLKALGLLKSKDFDLD